MTEGRPHWSTRRDSNQRQIERELRRLGFQVYDIAALPDSQCPGDILVYGTDGTGHQRWQPFEVKTPAGQLSESQRERDFVPVARCVEDVLEWYGRIEE
jgi:hypothetical protein